jgi:sigma-E factor negative regulatory protein RseB
MRLQDFWAGACLGASVSAWAASAQAAEPADVLIRAAQAGRNVTYQGVILYRGDENFEVLKVQHSFKAGSERERIDTMTGEPRRILRIDNHVFGIQPRDEMVTMDRPPTLKDFVTEFSPDRLRALSEWYEIHDQGLGRIAGRMCTGVALAPRDQFRYGYELWADQETGLPLKVSIVGQRGEVLEQVMFTEVSFPAMIGDEVFQTKVDPSKYKLVQRELPSLGAQVDNGDPQVTFKQLPPGFHVVARERHPLPDGQQGTEEHLLLSDGLSAVSVFSAIEQHTDNSGAAPGFRGVSHVGAIEAYGRTVGSYHITIVGEVPPQAIRMIGDGVNPVLPFDAPAAAEPQSAPAPDAGTPPR